MGLSLGVKLKRGERAVGAKTERQDTRQDIDRRRWKCTVDQAGPFWVSVIDLSRLDSSRPKKESVRLLVQ